MQNDLISRSALLESLNAINYKVQMPESHVDTVKKVLGITFEQVEKIIKEQPTAYDVEKVVAELENIKTNCVMSPADVVWNNAVAMCLKTVRNGGKE